MTRGDPPRFPDPVREVYGKRCLFDNGASAQKTDPSSTVGPRSPEMNSLFGRGAAPMRGARHGQEDS